MSYTATTTYPDKDLNVTLPSPAAKAVDAAAGSRGEESTPPAVMELSDVSVFYGKHEAVRGVDLPIRNKKITAMIGPSGCGKSTVLRSLNRMNDLIAGARVTGAVTYRGQDIYGPKVDPIQVRRHIGMVFQKPNPFPKSIYDNVAYGPRLDGIKKRAQLDEIVEGALTDAALWDEVKDKLKTSGLALSGGQQQRLCIARTIAVKPEIILMDEPCSALDPIATAKVEDLMTRLAHDYTIVIVTHNMQQAARVSDYTSFFTAEVGADGERFGRLVEYNDTQTLFDTPNEQRTRDYIDGRFG